MRTNTKTNCIIDREATAERINDDEKDLMAYYGSDDIEGVAETLSILHALRLSLDSQDEQMIKETFESFRVYDLLVFKDVT